MKYRVEKDIFGEKTITQEAYYGIGTERSRENFQLTKHGVSRQMIKALSLVKKVCAKTNSELGLINKKEAEALSLSADEILNGKLHGQFVVDAIHDGYGYGMDLNATEVICNRANEMLGSRKGSYFPISLETVSLYQDVNEINVLVSKIALIKVVKKLIAECKKTYNTIYKFLEDDNLDKTSYVYNQITSIAELLEKDTKRIDKAIPTITQISYGSKVPNEMKEKYLKTFIKCLNDEVTEKYVLSENYLSTSTNLDSFMFVSALVKNLMVSFSRSMSNLFALVEEGKIEYEMYKVGEEDKYNLMFTFVKQVSFYIVGNDMTVSRAIEEGMERDNPYLPIINASLHESINLVRRTIRTIKERIFENMKMKKTL